MQVSTTSNTSTTLLEAGTLVRAPHPISRSIVEGVIEGRVWEFDRLSGYTVKVAPWIDVVVGYDAVEVVEV